MWIRNSGVFGTNQRIVFALLSFLLRYRRTAVGPIWLLVGPSIFIIMLGALYAQIGAVPASLFVPHLAIGLITWTLVSGFVAGAPRVYQKGRAQILQGNQSLSEVVTDLISSTVIVFLHQTLIIAAVFVWFRIPLGWAALESLIGLTLLIANGIWATKVFGILGARYRDLSEVFQAVMRIAFLATPIIWMPGEGGRGGVMGAFLVFNPFYHFLEVVRAPLLGGPVASLSWVVVIGITVLGFALARFVEARYARYVPLWV